MAELTATPKAINLPDSSSNLGNSSALKSIKAFGVVSLVFYAVNEFRRPPEERTLKNLGSDAVPYASGLTAYSALRMAGGARMATKLGGPVTIIAFELPAIIDGIREDDNDKVVRAVGRMSGGILAGALTGGILGLEAGVDTGPAMVYVAPVATFVGMCVGAYLGEEGFAQLHDYFKKRNVFNAIDGNLPMVSTDPDPQVQRSIADLNNLKRDYELGRIDRDQYEKALQKSTMFGSIGEKAIMTIVKDLPEASTMETFYHAMHKKVSDLSMIPTPKEFDSDKYYFLKKNDGLTLTAIVHAKDQDHTGEMYKDVPYDKDRPELFRTLKDCKLRQDIAALPNLEVELLKDKDKLARYNRAERAELTKSIYAQLLTGDGSAEQKILSNPFLKDNKELIELARKRDQFMDTVPKSPAPTMDGVGLYFRGQELEATAISVLTNEDPSKGTVFSNEQLDKMHYHMRLGPLMKPDPAHPGTLMAGLPDKETIMHDPKYAWLRLSPSFQDLYDIKKRGKDKLEQPHQSAEETAKKRLEYLALNCADDILQALQSDIALKECGQKIKAGNLEIIGRFLLGGNHHVDDLKLPSSVRPEMADAIQYARSINVKIAERLDSGAYRPALGARSEEDDKIRRNNMEQNFQNSALPALVKKLEYLRPHEVADILADISAILAKPSEPDRRQLSRPEDTMLVMLEATHRLENGTHTPARITISEGGRPAEQLIEVDEKGVGILKGMNEAGQFEAYPPEEQKNNSELIKGYVDSARQNINSHPGDAQADEKKCLQYAQMEKDRYSDRLVTRLMDKDSHVESLAHAVNGNSAKVIECAIEGRRQEADIEKRRKDYDGDEGAALGYAMGAGIEDGNTRKKLRELIDHLSMQEIMDLSKLICGDGKPVSGSAPMTYAVPPLKGDRPRNAYNLTPLPAGETAKDVAVTSKGLQDNHRSVGAVEPVSIG